MLNKSGENAHTCLIFYFRRKAFSFPLLRVMFSLGILYMIYIKLSYISYMPNLWRTFYHELLLYFVKRAFYND